MFCVTQAGFVFLSGLLSCLVTIDKRAWWGEGSLRVKKNRKFLQKKNSCPARGRNFIIQLMG